MFTGIIEATGFVKEITETGGNKTFWIDSPISGLLKVDQSLCHNGVCLTVEELAPGSHRVTAISETLEKSSLGNWETGNLVNLERSLSLSSRLDGHFVQGHVDCVATCLERKEENGSWEFGFEFPKKFAELVIEKGSICLDGISLTIFNVRKKTFKVAIIPYTFEHTNIQNLKKGDKVNIEFDMLGKYITRNLLLANKKA